MLVHALAMAQPVSAQSFKPDYLAGLSAYVQKDYATALKLWRPLAEQGHAKAQYFLGLMHANGQGVPEDDVLAYMWYNLAAAQGNEEAQYNKDIAESRMTREQIAEAQRLSREWIEAHPSGN